MNVKIEEYRSSFRNNQLFNDDLKKIKNLIDLYKDASQQKSFEVWDQIIELAKREKWSRRKLDSLLEELVQELKHRNDYSDNLFNRLLDFLDCLEGNAREENIIRLNGDPEDLDELVKYVISEKWWEEDFYSQ